MKIPRPSSSQGPAPAVVLRSYQNSVASVENECFSGGLQNSIHSICSVDVIIRNRSMAFVVLQILKLPYDTTDR